MDNLFKQSDVAHRFGDYKPREDGPDDLRDPPCFMIRWVAAMLKGSTWVPYKVYQIMKDEVRVHKLNE